MSDSKSKQDPAAASDTRIEPSAGFEPQADPPALDPAEVRTPQAAEGEVEGAPAHAPPPAVAHEAAAHEPAQPTMDPEVDLARQVREVTEAALQAVAASATAQKLDAMSKLVLDAADLANRSAAGSTAAGNKLLETRTELEAELAKARRHGKIVLGVAGGIAAVSLLLTAAIVAQVSSRLSRLDATVLAVGKRFVEVGTGLENLTILNDSLAEMQARQEAFAQIQARLQANLEEANKASQGLVTQVPQATAKEVQARTQALSQQIQSIDSRVQAQAAAVKKMGEEMRAMQAGSENIGALKRDVEALVVLQKERYLETARATGAVGNRGPAAAPAAPPAPKGIQYPRPQPAGGESGAAAPAAAAGAGR